MVLNRERERTREIEGECIKTHTHKRKETMAVHHGSEEAFLKTMNVVKLVKIY